MFYYNTILTTFAMYTQGNTAASSTVHNVLPVSMRAHVVYNSDDVTRKLPIEWRVLGQMQRIAFRLCYRHMCVCVSVSVCVCRVCGPQENGLR